MAKVLKNVCVTIELRIKQSTKRSIPWFTFYNDSTRISIRKIKISTTPLLLDINFQTQNTSASIYYRRWPIINSIRIFVSLFHLRHNDPGTYNFSILSFKYFATTLYTAN